MARGLKRKSGATENGAEDEAARVAHAFIHACGKEGSADGLLALMDGLDGNLPQGWTSGETAGGWTALQMTCLRGNAKLARRLLEGGAEPGQAMENGGSPLYIACQVDNLDIATLLLDKGAAVGQAMDVGNTPLHVSVEKGHLDCAQLLLDRGARTDSVTSQGFRPLHLAAQHGSAECAKLLLANGAAADAKSNTGSTPLLLACAAGHTEVATELFLLGGTLGELEDVDAGVLRTHARASQAALARFSALAAKKDDSKD